MHGRQNLPTSITTVCVLLLVHIMILPVAQFGEWQYASPSPSSCIIAQMDNTGVIKYDAATQTTISVRRCHCDVIIDVGEQPIMYIPLLFIFLVYFSRDTYTSITPPVDQSTIRYL